MTRTVRGEPEGELWRVDLVTRFSHSGPPHEFWVGSDDVEGEEEGERMKKKIMKARKTKIEDHSVNFDDLMR